MHLDTEFIKLPLRFDAERLAEEVNQFTEDEWRAHPQGHQGNTALPFIAVNGNPTDDSVKGPMRPTPYLQRCPYLRQVLAALGTPLGRTRLMRIAGNGDEAHAHVDTNYYWMQRVRVHVPILTFPEVEFLCGGRKVNMPPGECWIFDTWRMHNVLNPIPKPRIHLVADTVGSASFWELVAEGERPFVPGSKTGPARFVPFDPKAEVDIELESFNYPVVMTPWEQESLAGWYFADLARSSNAPADRVERLRTMVDQFRRHWRSLWARYGAEAAGWPAYRAVLDEFQSRVFPLEGQLRLPNGMEAIEILKQALIRPALNPELAKDVPTIETPARKPSVNENKESALVRVTVPAEPKATASTPAANTSLTFERPIILVSAPRSGSTLLFETLARSPSVYTIGGESHQVFERIPRCDPAQRGFDSNRLTAEDADPPTVSALRASFAAKLRNRDGQPPAYATSVRLLEKTPKNALRVPFLNAVFPDALFIYLFREPHENISSIIEAWRSRKFITYPKLPDWPGLPWSLLLIPGWRNLIGKNLGDIAAEQWAVTNRILLDDLEQLPPERWTHVSYAELTAKPQEVAERLCNFAGISWDQELKEGQLPLSRHTLTPPDPNKWRKNAVILQTVLPRVEPLAARARALVGGDAPQLDLTPPAEAPQEATEAPRPPGAAAKPDDQLYMGGPPPAADGSGKAAPLKSVHTTSFAQLLERLGVSLLVTTYQAGKVIAVRVQEGKINTHFRNFHAPMGLAATHQKLAVGTKLHVFEYRNQPDVARKLEPVGKHDACYLPRSSHMTGDIRIHEIAWAGQELWIVNTRFSCLCTLDRDHSFVPRWRPPFVTALAPDDRCHLNGMGLVDGKPRYVTCLAKTDTAQGWREVKAHSGLVYDLKSQEIVASGLSMPHSPRWYQNKLWVLESGDGNLGVVDLKTGKFESLAQFPGFTRGLDFYQNFAFIGLSQVRETAIFSGIPLTDRLQERTCGVWVLDINTGRTVAFLRFDSGVQEIFAVQVLPGIRFPDIINDDEKILSNSFVLPDFALKDVPRTAGRMPAKAGGAQMK